MDTQPSNSPPLSEDPRSGTPSAPLPPPSEDRHREGEDEEDSVDGGRGRGRQTMMFTIINNYY